MVRRVLATLLMLALAACTSLNATPTPTPTLAPTPAPSAAATPTSTSPIDASRHADPDLEALLPDSLNGVHLTRESQLGTDLTRQSDAFDTFLAGLGRTPADFSLASAYSPT